ncbi:phosphoadenosine phosphosulfate reductase [Eubacterium barkeri]|uniref:Phosphoadenosine phosphosulfate reductase family protein n=1 Tax=Eubacterium barkeri TaxID=1528 RepID=A0A1H3IPM9_EUBBA|nr:phosphoadenosine phosphosulfate reductase [Eubacterium barkeri]SDY29783.1 hypothetical protein SAMN04488579_12437 [Eubacterium barkeri]
MKIVWFSAGVSSFIAAYLAKNVDEIIYTHINDQHPDSLRFVHDAEKVLGKPILITQSRYKSVNNVIQGVGYIKAPYGAPCTNILKRRVRKEWERNNPGRHTYVWGLDATEKERAERLEENMPEYDHEFPLIEAGITKQEAHGMAKRLGIKRPYMYELGYKNNNCIGCVKGGMGYWNKIRTDFPDVFQSRVEIERKLGFSILKDKNGPVFLDELDPKRGRNEKMILPECGIMCELTVEVI